MSEQRVAVSVPKPGLLRRRSATGSIPPTSSGRSRNSTNPFRANPRSRWACGGLCLTDTVLCYELQDGLVNEMTCKVDCPSYAF